MKKQVVVIHGGDTFETYRDYLEFLKLYEIKFERYTQDADDWKPSLRPALGEGYEVVLPVMPNKMNAQYPEWKLWLEKTLPYLHDEIILVGHSLGASFLAKYLSENAFFRKIKGVFLVSGVFQQDSLGHTLASFTLPPVLDLKTENTYLYHSKDDPVVPFAELGKFAQALPKARVKIFENRQHINQMDFPELVQDILSL